jgi:hypothetical protein
MILLLRASRPFKLRHAVSDPGEQATDKGMALGRIGDADCVG